jgi:glycosyltransferase involved in cell wall biosynthesis
MDERPARLRIAFLTAVDARDPRALSGTPYCMAQALGRHCGEVTCLGPVTPLTKRAGRAINALCQRTMGKRYGFEHSLPLARSYARFFRRRLARGRYDVIFADMAATEIARLDTDTPLIYASDITFALAADFYEAFSGLLRFSRRQGEEIERSAIERATLALFPSSWAARSAVEHYGADPGKVLTIPFGANFEEVPSREEVMQRQRGERCRLLFVGVDWQRKGGPIVLETLRRLEALGVEAELTVCGCVPPGGVEGSRVKVIPFLDKNDPRQRQELQSIYLHSDFFFLPSRAEAFGISLIEACAFGLPVISTDVGGLSDLVREGENGYLLSPEAGGEEYAQLIKEIFSDEERYRSLCRSARMAYEERLNWDAWASGITEAIRSII